MQFPIIKDIIKASGKEEYAKYLAFMPDLKQERTKKFTTIVLTLVASSFLVFWQSIQPSQQLQI